MRFPSKSLPELGPLPALRVWPSQWFCTYSHCVRMTLSPICSTVNPSTGSYRDRPIAWICSVLFIVSARRNVRYIIMGLVGDKQLPTLSSYHNTGRKESSENGHVKFLKECVKNSVTTNPPPKQIISTGLITAETKTDRLQLTNRD